MAKPEWGMKRTCQSCGARFYDMRRDPILCPICQAVYEPERQPRPRRGGSVIKDEPVLVAASNTTETADAVADDDLIEEEADDATLDEDTDDEEGSIKEISNEDSELMEDTSDLGGDDDLGEVMEHLDDEGEDKS